MTNHILILSGPPASLTEHITAIAQHTLAAARPGKVTWLAPAQACEIALATLPPNSAKDAAERVRTATGHTLDAAVVPTHNRRKRLLIADMDSTIIEQECLNEIAAAAGLGEQIARITERAMNGNLPFPAAVRERASLLKGISVRLLEEVAQTRLTLAPGAQTLTATMRAHGARTVLVSGGFEFFTSRIAARAGFDANHGNRFAIRNGRITGLAPGPVLGQRAKHILLRQHAQQIGCAPADVLAVGDGANDLAMLRSAGLGVAFHAKPVAVEAASVRIDHSTLTALLHLQGYRTAASTSPAPAPAPP